jgi:hypothetical protein
MASFPARPLTVFVLGLLFFAGLGLSTYTLPWFTGDPYGGIEPLVHQALHDAPDSMPVFPGTSGLPVPTALPETSHASPAGRDTAAGAEAAAWVRAAAGRDSSALRAWLGAWVLATATNAGDTIHVTLRRLALNRGCPLLSTLHALYLRGNGSPHLAAITASCPRVRPEAP